MEQRQAVGEPVYRGIVEPEWIDVNAHMNVAYYVLAFDRAVDALWQRIGITGERIAASRGSTFAVESHVTYQAEVGEGEEFLVTTQLLAYDEKRLHQFQRLYRQRDSVLAATAEWMNLHVDLDTRRVTAWPPDVLERIAARFAAQADSPWPAEAGKRMQVPAPIGVATAIDGVGE